MKVLYIDSIKEDKSDIESIDFSILPKRVGLLYTIQFKDLADRIKKKLGDLGKTVIQGKGNRTRHMGQILGCDSGAAIYIMEKVDCFLFIGSGKWHAQRILLSLPNDKPFFMLSGGGIERLDYQTSIKSREMLFSKFHFSENVGILVSTKIGQENLNASFHLKERIEALGKKVFIFISETINPSEFENFKISCWVNTACPGLPFDLKGMLNADELMEHLEKTEKTKHLNSSVTRQLRQK